MKNTLNNLTKIIATIALITFVSSCNHSIDFGNGKKGDGNWEASTRNITEEFDKIAVSNGIKLIVTQANQKQVTINTDHNLQSTIITMVENGTLMIKSNQPYNSSQRTFVEVSLPIIKGLSSSGGASIESTNKIVSEDLVIETSSASSVELSLEIENLILKTSSGSSIELIGKAINVDATASSGSSIECEKLVSNNVSAKGSSGSSIAVYPVVALIAKASSGATVKYFNKPQTADQESSSGGSVSGK